MLEQWESVGAKIEYTKGKLERTGWNVPGPLNLDDEEEDNVEQDDLNIGVPASPRDNQAASNENL